MDRCDGYDAAGMGRNGVEELDLGGDVARELEMGKFQDQMPAVADLGLEKDMLEVGSDRRYGEPQFKGDLCIGVAPAYQDGYILFARGQRIPIDIQTAQIPVGGTATTSENVRVLIVWRTILLDG